MNLNHKILESEQDLMNIPMSTDRSSKHKNIISITELNGSEVQPSSPNAINKVCHFLVNCFTCFQRPEEQGEYNYVQSEKCLNKRKEKTLL